MKRLHFFLRLLLFLSIAVNGYSTTILHGLIAEYKFENNAFNSQAAGPNGIEYGGISYVDGILGKAASFDGIYDYIIIPRHSSLSFYTNDFSVSFFFKTIDPWGYMLDERSGPERGYSLICDRNIDMTFGMGDGVVNNKGGSTSAGGFKDNKWHMATGTRKGEIISLYIDGVLQSQRDVNLVNVGASNNVWLGRRFREHSGYKGSRYNGLIDELLFYNRALNSSEVHSIYSEIAPVPEPATGLLAIFGIGILAFIQRKIRRKSSVNNDNKRT